MVIRQTGGSHIPHNSALLIQKLGIDDGPLRPIHIVTGQPLQQGQGSRAFKVNFPEAAHVNHARSLADCLAFFADGIEIGRFVPASPFSLILTG